MRSPSPARRNTDRGSPSSAPSPTPSTGRVSRAKSSGGISPSNLDASAYSWKSGSSALPSSSSSSSSSNIDELIRAFAALKEKQPDLAPFIDTIQAFAIEALTRDQDCPTAIQIMTIFGPHGIGKTTLLGYLASWANDLNLAVTRVRDSNSKNGVLNNLMEELRALSRPPGAKNPNQRLNVIVLDEAFKLDSNKTLPAWVQQERNKILGRFSAIIGSGKVPVDIPEPTEILTAIQGILDESYLRLLREKSMLEHDSQTFDKLIAALKKLPTNEGKLTKDQVIQTIKNHSVNSEVAQSSLNSISTAIQKNPTNELPDDIIFQISDHLRNTPLRLDRNEKREIEDKQKKLKEHLETLHNNYLQIFTDKTKDLGLDALFEAIQYQLLKGQTRIKPIHGIDTFPDILELLHNNAKKATKITDYNLGPTLIVFAGNPDAFLDKIKMAYNALPPSDRTVAKLHSIGQKMPFNEHSLFESLFGKLPEDFLARLNQSLIGFANFPSRERYREVLQAQIKEKWSKLKGEGALTIDPSVIDVICEQYIDPMKCLRQLPLLIQFLNVPFAESARAGIKDPTLTYDPNVNEFRLTSGSIQHSFKAPEIKKPPEETPPQLANPVRIAALIAWGIRKFRSSPIHVPDPQSLSDLWPKDLDQRNFFDMYQELVAAAVAAIATGVINPNGIYPDQEQATDAFKDCLKEFITTAINQRKIRLEQMSSFKITSKDCDFKKTLVAAIENPQFLTDETLKQLAEDLANEVQQDINPLADTIKVIAQILGESGFTPRLIAALPYILAKTVHTDNTDHNTGANSHDALRIIAASISMNQMEPGTRVHKRMTWGTWVQLLWPWMCYQLFNRLLRMPL